MNHKSTRWLWPAGLLASVIVAYATVHFGLMAIGLAMAVFGGLFLVVRGVAHPFDLALMVVVALPIQRIFSVMIGGTSLRLSALAGLLGAGVIGLQLATRRRKLQSFPIGWLIVAYLLIAAISATSAFDPSRSVKVTVFTIITIVIGWFVTQAVQSKAALQQLIRYVLIGAGIALVYGAYQYLGDFVGLPTTITGITTTYTKAVLGFPRLQSFMTEPLFFASYLFLPLGIVSALWINQIGNWHRGRILLFILIMVGAILLTVSRGALIAAGPFALTLALLHYRQALTARVIGISLALFVLVGGAGLGYLVATKNPAVEAFVAHAGLAELRTGEGESLFGRLEAFNRAIDAWQTSPVIGIGPGNFGLYVKGYPDPATLPSFDVVNNQYLEVLAETGIVGLIIYLLLLGTLAVRQLAALRTTQDPWLIAVLTGTLAAFVALLVQENFFSTLYIVYVWVLFGIMIAAQNVAFNTARSEKQEVRG